MKSSGPVSPFAETSLGVYEVVLQSYLTHFSLEPSLSTLIREHGGDFRIAFFLTSLGYPVFAISGVLVVFQQRKSWCRKKHLGFGVSTKLLLGLCSFVDFQVRIGPARLRPELPRDYRNVGAVQEGILEKSLFGCGHALSISSGR